MNNLDKSYQALLQDILDNGTTKQDRTGTGTISVFGRQIRHDMSEGFPLLTTKKMYWKGIVTELIWFLRGETNIKYLLDNDCQIWTGDAYKHYLKIYNSITDWEKDAEPISKEKFVELIKTNDKFAKEWGDLGRIYGAQWRAFGETGNKYSDHNDYHQGVDQILNIIHKLKTNPDDRRMLVTAWNPEEVDKCVLPPCHYGFQVYTRELTLGERMKLAAKLKNPPHEVGHGAFDEFDVPRRAISLMWNQRSVDTFLGLPFNIASYALLLEILAREVNMVPDELIGNLGDTHLYLNHIEQAKVQIGREGYELPNVTLSDIDMYEGKFVPEYFLQDDFKLENYQAHPKIEAALSN